MVNIFKEQKDRKTERQKDRKTERQRQRKIQTDTSNKERQGPLGGKRKSQRWSGTESLESLKGIKALKFITCVYILWTD